MGRISVPTTRLPITRAGVHQLPGTCDRQFRDRLEINGVALPAQQPDQRDAGIAVRQVQLQRLACLRFDRSVDVGGDLLLRPDRRASGPGGRCRARRSRDVRSLGDIYASIKSARGRLPPAQSDHTDTSRRFAPDGACALTISASASSAAWIWRLARNGSGSPVNRAISSSVRSCW